MTDQGADALDAMLTLDHPLKRAARDWAAEAFLDGAATTDDGRRALWKQAAAFGVQGSCTPAELGGRRRSAIDLMLTLEGLGLAGVDTGAAFALACQTVAVERSIAEFGTPDQHARWLPEMLAGESVGAFAMTEPTTGSDPWAMQSTAVERADGSFVLNATKTWTTLGPICDVAIVFAMTDPTAGHWGVSAFLVPADAAGFVRGPVIPKAGLESCPWGELTLVDVHVPRDHLLGNVGSGAAMFTTIVETERAFLYAPLLGAAEHVIERTIDRARSRSQGGRHIGGYQAVAHRIVGMKQRHEAARLMVYKAAALAERGRPVALATCLAKLEATELGPSIAMDAMRTFGASGFTKETGLDLLLRDSIGGIAFSATADIARNIAASELRLGRPARDA